MTRTTTTLVVLALALFVAACGGDDSTNNADGDGSDTPPAIEADDLDTGSYEPKGTEFPAKVEALADGRAIEAARIAEVLVDPAAIDDRFQRGGLLNGAMASPSQITRLFSSEDPKLFKDRISGAAASRRIPSDDGSGADIAIAVLTFTTPKVASTFVNSIAANNERTTINPIVGTPVYGRRYALPGHPAVRAATLQYSKDSPERSLTALTSRGQIAIYLFASGPLKQTSAVMSTALTAQLAAIEDFTPTQLTELLGMPVDEQGIAGLALAKTIEPDDQEPDVPIVWGRNGALLQQTWAGDLAEAFERADVDAMVQAGSNVYRTGSTKQATRLSDDFHETVTAEQYREHHTPKGLRDARCYRIIDEESSYAPYFCSVQYGRYIAEAAGASAEDAGARISAQYLLLQDATKD